MRDHQTRPPDRGGWGRPVKGVRRNQPAATRKDTTATGRNRAGNCRWPVPPAIIPPGTESRPIIARLTAALPPPRP